MSAARTRTRALLAAVAGLLVVVLLGTGAASAAQLRLTPGAGRVWAQTAARCQSAPLSLTAASGTSVRVTGVTAACVGRPMVVTLDDPTVTSSPQASRRFTGSATAATTTTVTGGTLTPVPNLVPRVTIDGWLVPATWTWAPPAVSCTIPASPSTPCTATVTRTHQWTTPATAYQWFVRVTSPSPTPVVWELTFNLSDPAFPFVANAFDDTQRGLVLQGASACSEKPRLVRVQGRTDWGQHHLVWAGKPSNEIEVQGYLAGTGSLLTCR